MKRHPKNKAERLHLKALHERDKLKPIHKDASDELRPEGVDEKE